MVFVGLLLAFVFKLGDRVDEKWKKMTPEEREKIQCLQNIRIKNTTLLIIVLLLTLSPPSFAERWGFDMVLLSLCFQK